LGEILPSILIVSPSLGKGLQRGFFRRRSRARRRIKSTKELPKRQRGRDGAEAGRPMLRAKNAAVRTKAPAGPRKRESFFIAQILL